MDTPFHGAAQPTGHRGRSALLAGLLALLSSTPVVAQPVLGSGPTPAAVLLPPRPAPTWELVWPREETVRASSADLNSASPYHSSPPVGGDGTARTERAPDPARTDYSSPPGAGNAGADQPSGGRTYPPAYSSGRRSGLLDLAPTRASPTSTAASPEPLAPPSKSDTRPSSAPISMTSPNIPSDHTLVAPPAWRWYGYGAMHPAMNPLTANGRMQAATANWLTQSGATPGAFPQTPHLPPPPEIPVNAEAAPYSRRPFVPSSAEPPLSGMPPRTGGGTPDFSRNFPGVQPVSAESLKPAVTGAALGSPLPPTGIPLPPGGGPSPELVLPGISPPMQPAGLAPGPRPATLAQPQSLNNRGAPVGLGPIARGQAPDKPAARPSARPAPRQLCERIRSAAGPMAHGLRVEQHGEAVLKVKLSVARQDEAEQVVNRIASVPELAPYRVDFEVSSR